MACYTATLITQLLYLTAVQETLMYIFSWDVLLTLIFLWSHNDSSFKYIIYISSGFRNGWILIRIFDIHTITRLSRKCSMMLVRCSNLLQPGEGHNKKPMARKICHLPQSFCLLDIKIVFTRTDACWTKPLQIFMQFYFRIMQVLRSPVNTTLYSFMHGIHTYSLSI